MLGLSCLKMLRWKMSNKWQYIVIGLLVCLLIFQQQCNVKTEKVVEVKRDTITNIVRDTIFYKIPTFFVETIVDTIVVEKDGETPTILPKYQRFYSGKEYNAWVSGYRPQLDSIKIFTEKEYVTITNTIKTEVERKDFDLYLTTGFSSVDKQIVPNIGVSLVTPYRFSVGGGINLSNSKVGYEFKIGYKVF